MIDEILDFTKIEAGSLEMESINFDLHSTIREVVDLFALQAQQQNIVLETRGLDQTPASVQGDEARLRQILLNLVSNGVKFTSVGSVTVEVEAHWFDEGASEDQSLQDFQLVVGVRDTGIGVEPEFIARLFEPFTQGDASMSRQYGGSGLGLAISRHLAHLLGGDITFESHQDRGTFVVLSIPMTATRTQVAANVEVVDQAREAPGQFRGRRLLLVEDNSINQLIVCEQLESEGFEVLLAEDGEQALKLLAEQPVELVFMDCQMPKLDGYEATRRWRRQESGERLPIIALTAHALVGERKRCLDAGMDDFITKPFRISQLTEVIARWLPFAAS